MRKISSYRFSPGYIASLSSSISDIVRRKISKETEIWMSEIPILDEDEENGFREMVREETERLARSSHRIKIAQGMLNRLLDEKTYLDQKYEGMLK